MELEWYKCKKDVWCELNKLDLDHRYVKWSKGVYIIWYRLQANVVVKIGGGKIRDELEKEREELAIQAFSKYGLKVSWADVPKSQIEPVMAYLSRKISPKIPIDDIDKSKQIEVNLPWEE